MMNYELLTPAVERAAGIAKSKFPAHHDMSDVKQDIWLWVMENKGTVLRILSEDNYEAVLNQYLVRAAHESLKTEDAQVYIYDEQDRFYYSLDLIKNILEVIFQYEDWQSFSEHLDSMPRAKSDPSQGGNNLASYADVKSAVEKLPEDLYNIIVWRYKYRFTQAQIGLETGTTRQAVQSRLETAHNAIQRSLGERELSEFRKGYEGRTEPRGNAASNAHTERDYEG